MSRFARFMKNNKKIKQNALHPVTKSLCDEQGNPLEWEFKHISTKENEEIRESCIKEVPIPGKPNAYRLKMQSSMYVQKFQGFDVSLEDKVEEAKN